MKEIKIKEEYEKNEKKSIYIFYHIIWLKKKIIKKYYM